MSKYWHLLLMPFLCVSCAQNASTWSPEGRWEGGKGVMKLNLNMYPDGKLNLVVGTTTAPGVWVKDKSGSVAVRSQSKKGFQFEGDLKRASNNKADFRLNKYHVSLTRVSAVAPKPIPIVRSKTPYKAKPKAKPAPVAKTAVKPTVKLTVEPKASPKQDPSLKRSYHLNSVSE